MMITAEEARQQVAINQLIETPAKDYEINERIESAIASSCHSATLYKPITEASKYLLLKLGYTVTVRISTSGNTTTIINW